MSQTMEAGKVTLTLPDWLSKLTGLFNHGEPPKKQSMYEWFKGAIVEHERWEVGRYTLRDKVTGRTFWIANGGWFFNGYENTPPVFGIYEKWMSWIRFKMNVGSIIEKGGWNG